MKEILVAHIFAVVFMLPLEVGLPRFGGHFDVGTIMRREGAEAEDMAC